MALSSGGSNVPKSLFMSCFIWPQHRMRLGPVIAGACLTKHKVVWAEQLAEWSGTNAVHGSFRDARRVDTWTGHAASVQHISAKLHPKAGTPPKTWFKVHQNGSGYVTSAGGFIEVDVDALQLKIRISVVGTCHSRLRRMISC